MSHYSQAEIEMLKKRKCPDCDEGMLIVEDDGNAYCCDCEYFIQEKRLIKLTTTSHEQRNYMANFSH